MVSGFLCFKKFIHVMKPSESSRLLALIRRAKDSAKDIECYKANANIYLTKAPVAKLVYLNSIYNCFSKENKSKYIRSNN